MSIDQMRHEVAKAYSGEKWKHKVKNMPDDQILAIYTRFLNSGKLKK